MGLNITGLLYYSSQDKLMMVVESGLFRVGCRSIGVRISSNLDGGPNVSLHNKHCILGPRLMQKQTQKSIKQTKKFVFVSFF